MMKACNLVQILKQQADELKLQSKKTFYSMQDYEDLIDRSSAQVQRAKNEKKRKDYF
jgi:hypothetical protein